MEYWVERLALWCCSALGSEPEQGERNVLEFSGGDSGIRTPDLRIMMKIAPIFIKKINGLQRPNPTV